ncbi:MAG: lasso peptide biosynthesis B2 protein [Pseudomonadota bacterium]
MTTVIARKMRRLAGLPGRRKRLLVEAAVALALARLATAFIPFRVIAAGIGRSMSPEDGRATLAAQSPAPWQEAAAADIGWAVRCAASQAPFRALCLQQALAARSMLAKRRIRSALFFGVLLTPGAPMQIHAWLDTPGQKLIGYPVAARFSVLACWC